jgi:curved DNA-binding protein CbpA
MVSFYELLEIDHNANDEEIIRAFKKKAMVFHPDKNNGSEASEAMFKLLQLAKETLLDPQKRLKHDYAMSIKKRPSAPPKIIKVPVYKKETNVGQVVGWSLLAFIVGIALGGAFKDK